MLGKEDGHVFRKFCKFNLEINLGSLRRCKPMGVARKQWFRIMPYGLNCVYLVNGCGRL